MTASGYELALLKTSPGWTDETAYTIDYSTAYAGAFASKEFTDHKETHSVAFTVRICTEDDFVQPTFTPDDGLNYYIFGTSKVYNFVGASSPCSFTTEFTQIGDDDGFWTFDHVL